jgi:polyisoprenoid-binding protein YceI
MRASIRVPAVCAAVALGAACGVVSAAPVTYKIDSRHSFPSFEADHFGGMSVWRGKFNETSGTIVLDREAKTGTVDVTIVTRSVSTGLADLDKHLKGSDFFDVEKFSAATYKGKFSKFKGDVPTEVQGDLTIRGISKPVTLTLTTFKCMVNPFDKKTFCGADAHATFDREQYGMDYGKSVGFEMGVKLAIQVEARPVE